MDIAFVESHAKWMPHQSGYDQYVSPTENDIARMISNTIIAILEDRNPLDRFAYIEMDESYRCKCTSEKKCKLYNSGLRSIVLEASKWDFAIQFHIDYSPKGGGPLLISKGGDNVRIWGAHFLNVLEALSGHKRRGSRAYKGVHYNGNFDYENPDVKEAFGRKYFLEKGAPNAIIVEIGCINNKKDYKWLNSGQAIYNVVEASCIAFDNIF